MQGSVEGPTDFAIQERLRVATPRDWNNDQQELVYILAEYDHAHAPSNWEPKYRQEHYIVGWAADLYPRDRQLVDKLLCAWKATSNSAQKAARCGQWGNISNLLFEEMMNYMT
jgi:hypothetical protein